MRLLRLRIANFRGVREAEAVFAERGVTLVQGRNETGKTSMKDAVNILFGFKDNSADRTVRNLQPVGEDVGPEIELEARAGAYRFVYRKTFIKGRRTELRILEPEEKSLVGTPAHEEAERILNQALDRTLWDALAVGQGEGAFQPDLAGCKPLMEALDRAAGGGGGYDRLAESLFDRVRAEYLLYYTQTGKEGRDLTAAAGKLKKAEERELALEEASRTLEAQAGKAEDLRKALVDLRGRQELLSRERDRRRRELEAVELLEREAGEGKFELRAAEGQLLAAERGVAERRRLIEDERAVAGELEALGGASGPEPSGIAEADARFEAARLRLDGEKTARDMAEQMLRLRRRDFEYFDDLLHLDSMRKRKARLDESLARARAAREELSDNPVTRDLVERIAGAELEVATLEGRLEAENTHVGIRGIGDGRVLVDGNEVVAPGDAPLAYSVREGLRIVVPGRVEITVAAGALPAGSAGAAKALEAARKRFDSLLVAGKVDSLKDAYAALDRRERAEAALAAHDGIAAECLNDLSYEELAERIGRLEAELPRYPENRDGLCEMAPGLDAAKKLRDEAERMFRDIDLAHAGARDEFEAARDAREAMRRTQIDRAAEAGVLRKRLDLAAERLRAARDAASDEALLEALAAAEAEAKRLGDRLKAKSDALAGIDPENVRLLFETASQSLDAAVERRKGVDRELIALESALEASGERGVFEDLQEARMAAEAARMEEAALRRRAEAAKLLHETLVRHRDETRKRYVLPLKAEVERLGRVIFGPTLKVGIDDATLSISERTLKGRTVPFQQLSGGAKEQLALVYRAACSTMAGGEAPPIILDDALGYTDPDRLLTMGAVLAKVAREAQVIVFTCVPDRYRNVGNAKVVDLA